MTGDVGIWVVSVWSSSLSEVQSGVLPLFCTLFFHWFLDIAEYTAEFFFFTETFCIQSIEKALIVESGLYKTNTSKKSKDIAQS